MQPVIVVVGHIDHGKSTLLDYIRKTNVTGEEVGGITQRLGAYEVVHKNKDGVESRITFLDTPGHEAFKGIRERGARVADIAILVVSAEDGVKPQTVEAYRFVKASGIQCIVAVTKIDKPNASLERAKQSLAEHEIFVEGYGGEIPIAAVSGKTGEGVSDLLDLVLLMVEMHPLAAREDAEPSGFVIEAEVSKVKGVVATVILKEGALKTGAYAVAERASAPIRRLENFLGEVIQEARPGMPVQIAGWSELPRIGARFAAVANRKVAEKMQEAEELVKRAARAPKKEDAQSATEEKARIPIILKANTGGSLEALVHEVMKLSTDKVAFQIVAQGVGRICEADLKTAFGCSAPVIAGLGVGVDAGAASLTLRGGVTVLTHEIIYTLSKELEELARARTPKVKVEETTGSAKILKIFSVAKDRQIVGGKVQTGELRTGDDIKIFRREVLIGNGRVRELQRLKEKVSSVPSGSEFGAAISGSIEVTPQDRIDAITIRET